MSDFERKKPSFEPTEQNLNDFIAPDKNPEKVREVIKNKAEASSIPETAASAFRAPLTAEEAQEIERAKQILKSRIVDTKKRISSILERIDKEIISQGDASFSLDISKRRNLKRAVKKVFGYETESVTYQMYKQAVEQKATIESQDTKEYLKNGGVSNKKSRRRGGGER